MKLKIGNEVVFYQKDNKFKNIILGIFLVAPIDMKYHMEWPILSSLLEKTNALYPTEQELQNYSYENYGLNISIDTYYSGTSYLFRFFSSYVNPKYLPEEIDLTEKAFKLLETTILNPSFTEEKLEVEKYYVKNSLLNKKNNKQKYAYQEFMKVLCQGSITEKMITRTIEELDKVTLESIKDAYSSMLTFSRLCFIAGDIKKADVKKYFENLKLPHSNYNYQNLIMYEKLIPSEAVLPKEVIVDDPTKSSILYIGYKTNTYYFDDDFYVFGVLSMILGGSSYSETYQKIREEQSLVYYVDCSYDKRRGTVVFSMETSKENYDQLINTLNAIIHDYQSGKINERIMELAKMEIANMLNRENDRESSVCNGLYDELDHIKPLSLDEVLKKYLSITKEDIIRAANKMKLDTIYFLRGE